MKKYRPPPPGLYHSVVKEVTNKKCIENNCNNILCIMITVEIEGGPYDGRIFDIGACRLSKRND